MIGAIYDFLSFFFPADWAINNFHADPKSFSCYTAIILFIGIGVGVKRSFDTDGAIFRTMSPEQAKIMLSFLGKDGLMQPLSHPGKATDFNIEALIASGMIHEVDNYHGKAYVIAPSWFARVKRHKRRLRKISKRGAEENK